MENKTQERKLEIGQELLLKPIGNNTRYLDRPKKASVTKIGRKYFYVKREGSSEVKGPRFFIDDLSHDNGGFCRGWKVYFSEQEIKDEDEARELKGYIVDQFDWRARREFSLEDLRKIADILKESE